MQMDITSVAFLCYGIKVIGDQNGYVGIHPERTSLFQLKEWKFNGHCFGCDQWRHFKAKYKHAPPPSVEIPNEGVSTKGVQKDFGMFDVVVMDEVALFGVGDKSCSTSKIQA